MCVCVCVSERAVFVRFSKRKRINPRTSRILRITYSEWFYTIFPHTDSSLQIFQTYTPCGVSAHRNHWPLCSGCSRVKFCAYTLQARAFVSTYKAYIFSHQLSVFSRFTRQTFCENLRLYERNDSGVAVVEGV